MIKYDAIIVLGGGRYNDGSLTELSKQRLDAGAELFKKGVAPKIFALGEKYSTYRPGAICFPQTGASLRSKYLREKGVPKNNIILLENGRDTINEALVCNEKCQELEYKKILVVTSDKHLPRALYIFKKVFGKGYSINGQGVPCGDLLIEEEEKEYLEAFKKYLFQPELYKIYGQIHDKFHPSGQESQAYAGVKDSGLRPE